MFNRNQFQNRTNQLMLKYIKPQIKIRTKENTFYKNISPKSCMKHKYSPYFFENSDYEKLISADYNKLDTKNAQYVRNNIIEIAKIKDVYIRIYLLNHIKPKCNFLNDEILKILGTIVKDYKDVRYPLCDVNNHIKKMVLDNFNNEITIEAFCNYMCYIDFEKNELKPVRKYFGFASIHKYFKSHMNHYSKHPISREEIVLLLKLLERDELALSTLSEIFEMITKYVRHEKKLDDDFFNCFSVLDALVTYKPDIDLKKTGYISGIIKYMLISFSNPENSKYTMTITVKRLGQTMEGLLKNVSCVENNNHLKQKLHRRAYNSIRIYMENKTSVFEEIISITFLLEVLYILNSDDKHPRHIIFKDLKVQEFLVNFDIKKPHGVSDGDYTLLLNDFYTRKYKLLDLVIEKIDDFDFNNIIFSREILYIINYQEFFENINNLWKYIEWNSIIHIACQKENLEGFVDAITNETCLKSKDHGDFVFLYIHALYKNNYHSLILLTIKNLIEYYKNNDISDSQLDFLIALYLMDIENNTKNNNIEKKHRYLLNFFYYQIENDLSDIMLNKIMIETQKLNILNTNVLLLILIVARKTKKIEINTLDILAQKIIKPIASKYEYHNSIDDNMNLNIAALETIINFHKKELCITEDDYNNSAETFIKILIALLSCFFAPANKEYMISIKKMVLNYLFNANGEEKKLIGSLLSKVDANINFCQKFKNDLIAMGEFMMRRVLVLH